MYLTSKHVTKKHAVVVGIALFFVLLASLHFTDTVPVTIQTLQKPIETLQNAKAPTWYASLVQPQKEHCKWEFSHYEPSDYETEWFAIIEAAQYHICETIGEPRHAENSMKIVRRIENLTQLDDSVKWTTYDTELPVQPHPDDSLFSRMHYKRVCYDSKTDTFKPASGRGAQLIEPLWGMLRDPFDIYCRPLRLTMPTWDGRDEGQSKEAIMPQGFAPYTYDLHATTAIAKVDEHKQSWRSHGLPPWHSSLTPSQDAREGTVFEKPRRIFADLGSSYFGEWGGKDRPGFGMSAAASGKWFYNTYHARGQKFDEYVAVELAELNATEAYEQIPPDLVGVYNLINTGLTMEAGHKLNIITMLKRMIKPNDFFVFKLDIDTPSLEMPIIQSLLDDDPAKGGASALIDELMFEHHVVYEPMMSMGWASGTPSDSGDLAFSYRTFRDLRKKSIRAHSWP